MTKGYLYVATLSKAYYRAMVHSIQSLKDEVPDAKVAVFTHKDWVDKKDEHLFDHLVTPVPTSIRTKLWALDKTPFDLTLYVDCDTYILTEEIDDVFDLIGDADVMMTENRPYNAKVVYFSKDDQEYKGSKGRELDHFNQDHLKLFRDGKACKMRWHCGLFVYRKNDRTDKLWQLWLSTWRKHNETENGHKPFPKEVRFWDTFAFYRILEENPDLVDIRKFPGDAKYNWITGYRSHEVDNTPALFHYTIPKADVDEGYEKDIENRHGSFELLK
jgi:hypothetical protein